MYNILLGGAAGQGVDTTTAILEKLLKRSGHHILTVRDFMSRIRGGHNFMLLRFGPEMVYSHDKALNAIVALNEETYHLHEGELLPEGFVLCVSALQIDDPRAVKLDMAQMAKTLGNPKVQGTVAIGAVLKLFGETLNGAEDALPAFVKEQYLEINLKALKAGYDAVEARYPHLSGDASGELLISGSKAMALGALAAGLTFYSAYPMSPATPVLESLAEMSKATNIVVEQAEDEIAAINMAIGASFAGARAMTGTSGGGFSLMVEALGLSGMAEIPVVIVNVQRPGPVTGLPTRTEQSDLLFTISASQGEFPRMVIAPTNPEDAFYQTMRAFDLAEKYQIPVLLLSDQYLGDSSYTVPMLDPRKVTVAKPASGHEGPEEYLRYRDTESGVSPRLLPGFTENLVTADSDEHDERGAITESAEVRNLMMEKRMRKLDGLVKELKEPELAGAEDYETLLVGWGSTWGPIREALNLLNAQGGGKYAALIFSDVYPLPTKLLTEKAAKAKELVNVEQNFTGQLAKLIRMETGIRMNRSILKYDGRQISGREIAEELAKGGAQ
jgi:2-oxoglutarate ferredoxin oxidoreductase subunit alpha